MELFVITKEQFEAINQKLEYILSKVSAEHETVKDWLSAKEAQELLNIGQTTLWTYRNQGLIKASKINKKLYFNRSDIYKLLTSKSP